MNAFIDIEHYYILMHSFLFIIYSLLNAEVNRCCSIVII